MDTSHIRGFLERYRKIVFQNEEKYDIICEVVGKILGSTITKDAVTIKNGELYITANSVLKSELFLHKTKLLDELRKKGLAGISDIH